MIVTRQNRIPFSWVIVALLPWAMFYFQGTVSGVNFFIIKRFIDNPAALTFVISLPGILFTFIPLGSYISFMSDRVWTRWGRRKIFCIAGLGGWAIVLFLYPLAPNIWFFIGLTFVMAFVGAFNAPLEALKLEIIPPPMRGRSAALWQWITTTLNITFWLIVIGRLDEVTPFAGFALTGDKALYWSASAGLLIAVFIYFFGVHEVNPRSTITGQRFSLRTAWQALTMKELRYLYLLLFATSMLTTGLGAMGWLLYTEQWGYSLQEMGFNIAVGGVINLFLIPVIGIFADKGSRMKIYLICLSIILTLNVTYFSYVTWVLPDQRPSLFEIIFFGETTCIFSLVAGMVYYPLVYDYIQRNLMGTYFAGAGILASIIGFLTLNGLGLFLLGWATLFQPPAGDMVRVCMEKSAGEAEVLDRLTRSTMTDPDGAPVKPSRLSAKPWYADGVICPTGLCFEIRVKDPATESRRKHRDELKGKAAGIEAKIKMDRNRGTPTQAQEQKLSVLEAEIKTLDATLTNRVDAWRAEVVRALGDTVMKPGQELRGVARRTATTGVIPTTCKANAKQLERFNRLLRHEDESLVDLQPIHTEQGFGLSLTAVNRPGEDGQTGLQTLYQRVVKMAGRELPGVIAKDAALANVSSHPAAVVDLTLVENPVKNRVSPITRAVNVVLSPFTEPPPPDQKLHSLARMMCRGEGIGHARVDSLAGGNGLRITAVASGPAITNQADWVETLADRARKEAADLRLTIPNPIIATDAVPLKYNYLAGYVYMFIMVAGGFGLILFFIRQERRGKIQKLGAMEAHAEKTAAERAVSEALAAAGTGQPVAATGVTYTPGYLLPKIVFALIGLAVFSLALRETWPNLRLAASGRRGEAVAVAVIARKPGQPEVRLASEAEVKAKCASVAEAKDYGWVFYNEFSYETHDHKTVTFVRNVGCKLKPSLPILDENGLPTTVTICTDPRGRLPPVLPYEYSTWFAPGIVGILGLVAFFVGTTLARAARRPILLNNDPAISAE